MAAFLKLDDIKGEIVLDTKSPSVTVCVKDAAGFKNDALANRDAYDGAGGEYVSGYREDSAN